MMMMASVMMRGRGHGDRARVRLGLASQLRQGHGSQVRQRQGLVHADHDGDDGDDGDDYYDAVDRCPGSSVTYRRGLAQS